MREGFETPEYDQEAALHLSGARGRFVDATRLLSERLDCWLRPDLPPGRQTVVVRGGTSVVLSTFLGFQDGEQRGGYADSVVGLTAIEYESDLTDRTRFTTGKHQVRQYMRGLAQYGSRSVENSRCAV